jgi:alpha-galactosidase
MFSTVDEVRVDARTGRVYEHGWQSWSPTATHELSATSPRPEHGWQQVMRFRPGTPAPQQGFQGEGLLVLDPGDGQARVYTAADPSRAVASIRAELVDDKVVVTADGPVDVMDSTGGIAAALVTFADQCAAQLGAPPPRPPPTVWCSWYRYYHDVTEADIVENLDQINQHDLPIDVVQLDDGWQADVGDWLHLSDRFGSLPDLAHRIHDSGRRAGIWLAPFTAGSNSALAREHPEWLTGEGGANWDQQLRGLDVTNPKAREYLRTVFERLVGAGFDYFKLDFLYTGALPGHRHEDVEPVAAYRSGLELIRDAVGAAAYLLGCGAPILPSVGLVDAMRVSPDVYNPTDSEPGSARLRGKQGTVSRAWQHGRFWVNDPDSLITRPSFELRVEWAEVVQRYGGLRSSSDRIAELDDWGLDTTRRVLTSGPGATPFPFDP